MQNSNPSFNQKTDTNTNNNDNDYFEQSHNKRPKRSEMSENSIVTKDRSSTVIQSSTASPKEARGNSRSPRKHSFVQRPSATNTIKLNSRKKVNFKAKGFIEVVNVESYKKYNADNCFSEDEEKDNTRCRCLIF